ncbi:MAG: TonB-dependent receptor [Bacteroidales bacterium]
MFKRIAVLMASWFIVLGAQAQLSITGTVTDEQDQPLAGAHVLLEGTLKGVSTDFQGHFHFPNLRAGDYRLKVTFIGFQPLEYPVSLIAPVDLKISLEQARVMAGEVVVRATRANRTDPVAYTNITKEELGETNRVQDIPYLLALTPSLVVTSDGGTGVGYTGMRIRGTDPTRINVTINGIPFNNSESHEVYWVDIPDIISSTENIQIQRGVGTSTQGAGAFGANINLQTTAMNPKPYARLSAAAGSFNTWKTAVSAGTGLMADHFSVDARLSRIHSDGFIDRAFTDLLSIYLSGGYFSKKSIIKAILFTGQELTYQAWGGVPSELLGTNRTYNPYTYENEVDDYKMENLQLSWSQLLAPNLDFTVALHYTGGRGYYEQFRENAKLAEYLIDPLVVGSEVFSRSDLVRRKWLDNQFVGAVYSLNYHSGKLGLTTGGGLNRYDGDHFGRVIWSSLAPNAAPNHQYYYNRGLKSEVSPFVRANYTLLRGLNLYADLQYRFIDYRIDGLDDDLRDITLERRYHFLNPKGGMTLDLAGNSQLFVSYALARREPKRSNFTDARPGQEIRPETLRDLEAGWRYASSKLAAELNLYWMDYTDQLVLTGEINDVGAPIMVNIPDSYRAGVELAFKITPVRLLSWDMNLTLSRNRILNFTEYVDDWDTWGQQAIPLGETNLSFSPSVITGSRITWFAWGVIKIALDSKLVGRQFIDNTSNPDRSLDPYFVNSINLSYPFKFKRLGEGNLFFQVNNIFNEKYETNAWVYSYFYEGARQKMDGYFPQAGVNFLIGLALDLSSF